jgi:hypothetical protein
MNRKERAGLAKALKAMAPDASTPITPRAQWLRDVVAAATAMEELGGSFDASMFLKACGVKL